MCPKKTICLRVLFLLTVLLVHNGLYANIISAEENKPVFNEIMSSIIIKKDGYSVWNGSDNIQYNNYRTPSEMKSIPDDDGDYPDWLELYNPGTSPVDLTGYGLSDNTTDPFKWVFPECSIEPGDYMLIFASGKDRKDSVNFWEIVINKGDEWKYFIGTKDPPEDWRFPDFDDSVWDSGPSGFGFGDDDDETVIQGATAFYIRKKFNIEDVANITDCILQIDYDDAFVAYLNGTEIARANIIGEEGVPPPRHQTATESIEATMYTGGKPSVFNIDNFQSALVPGENVLAIQVHNYNIFDTDLTAIPFFTLGMSSPPSKPQEIPDILKFSLVASMHTNFKISATGETLVLTDNSGNICDSVETGVIPADMSLGRQPDGEQNWVFFAESTPYSSNTTVGKVFADSVIVSQNGGFYNSAFNVSLSCNSTNAVIRYTTNGSDPVESSQQYTTPLSITKTTVIKAGAFEDGLLPGKISTNTYIINEKSTLPVISIATDPDGFFSDSKGIYVDANDNEESWERKIHIEFYEPDGTLGFSVDAGARIQGKSAAGFPQKALSIFVRGRYGYDAINYKIFPDLPINEFKSLILRNSGNDWMFTMFRDGLTSSLFTGIDLDTQAYRPAIAYINGEYWGIHNIREKHNEEYFESHHGADPDNIDLLKPYWRVERPDGAILLEGDYEHYDAMLDYMADHDLSIEKHYNYIETQIDIPVYINYLILEIFGDNKDWNGNNIKLWRPRTDDGKWRWLPWDLDCAFGGLYDLGATRGVNNEFGFNTLAFATDPRGGWPYQPWTTFILRKLLENQSFENDFINRFSDCLNSFLQNHIVMQKIHDVKSTIEPEMPNHIARWGSTNRAIKSMDDWYSRVRGVEEFGETRADSIRFYITEKFNLSGSAQITIDTPQPGTGTIRINTLPLDEFPWSGTYFKDVPVRITAKPAYGYRFAGWSGIAAQDSISIDVNVNDNLTLTAHFEAAKDVSGPIVINEINYNSSTDFNPEDWVELYNTSTEKIELSGWVFKDEDDAHKFVFPDNTVIEPDDYIVLCRDKSLFHQMFPDIEKYIGDISFGLSGRGELVRLYNAMGELVNSLTYDNNPPWPEAADGRGSTLELLNPSLDNILPGNWAPSISHGTPGEKNDVFITGVENTSSPAVFSLGQNYPNPFNPVTTIPFHVSHGGRVTIDVYSVLGQRVATVIDRDINPGHHTVIFSSDDLAAGLYFYTIKTGRFIKTKQMMLLK
jgi:uncharacterized repeat protein (TIGR02543 family)